VTPGTDRKILSPKRHRIWPALARTARREFTSRSLAHEQREELVADQHATDRQAKRTPGTRTETGKINQRKS
jgi:hypothetical protein